ncbi:MAG: restriction endonuclease subunit R, partial [Proteobacteria bacterium]|nr:restriction endonuclease subunit R [Pseudomonadota bacterium]
CWENFEFFKMNPEGKIEKPSKPLPVRLFEIKLEKLNIAEDQKNNQIAGETIQKLKEDIAKLPQNNVVILDAKSKLDRLDEVFWQRLDENRKIFLQKEIAPLMRARTGEDYKAMSFELRVIAYSIAKLKNETLQTEQIKKSETLEEVIIEMVSDLPLSVNIVAKEKDLIEEILHNGYLVKAGEKDLETLIQKIAPLMKYREEGIKPDQDSLDLRDITSKKEFIKFGPANERITIQKYREKVEALIKKLEEENDILKKIKDGAEITQDEVEELANNLLKFDPYPTEENLQKAYDARKVRFLDLIKYIMGIGGLVTFSEKVSEAFAEFIADNNNLSSNQIQFLIVLRDFIIQNGSLSKKDLVNEPFTKLHNRGFLGLFDPAMQTKILLFTNKILDHAELRP